MKKLPCSQRQSKSTPEHASALTLQSVQHTPPFSHSFADAPPGRARRECRRRGRPGDRGPPPISGRGPVRGNSRDETWMPVVSSDGLPLAFSAGFPQERADQLAAVTSGLTSLTQGASRVFEGGAVVQTVVEMQRGVLVIMAISNGSSLAVLAASTCDLGLVAYEMTLLVERAGRVLTPATRGVMQAAIPGDGRR